MAAPLLQVVHALYPQAAGEVELFTWEVAQTLGGAVLSLTPAAETRPQAWADLQVLCAQPGEGALTAWHRALDTVQPQAVFVQHLGTLNPALLLDLRERGIPYAMFLHDFTPLCPTHRLWHRGGERCSGPGRTGWKCAWCVSGTRRRAAELPLRTFLYRHRPQDWRTALLRAEVLVASSRFARDFWIEQGAPPERIAVIAPRLRQFDRACLPAVPGRVRPLYTCAADAAEGVGFLEQTLERLGLPVEVRPATGQARFAPGDVVAVPARWEQPFSRLVAEAQAAGAHAVATAVGGLSEQIIHGVNGFLSSPDDPAALAEALREAFASEPAGWGGALVMSQAQAAVRHSETALRAVLDLMLAGASEPDLAIELEHGNWLRQQAAGGSGGDPARQLVAALRGSESSQAAYEQRAFATTRQRRLDLNRAVAFFRACGSRRLGNTGDTLATDVVEYFYTWGLEFVNGNELPDGLWFEGDHADVALLRRRYPQAKALVESLPEGMETLDWTDDDELAM